MMKIYIQNDFHLLNIQKLNSKKLIFPSSIFSDHQTFIMVRESIDKLIDLMKHLSSKIFIKKSLFTSPQCFSTDKYFRDEKYQNFQVTTKDNSQSLNKLISIFTNTNIKLTYLKTLLGNTSRAGINSYTMQFSIERSSKEEVQKMKSLFLKMGVIIQEVPIITVPWFPRKLEDLNLIGKTLLEIKDKQNNKDHPSFADPQYRKRRDQIAKIAINYKIGDKIPIVNYTPQQHQLWRHIYSKLKNLHQVSMSSNFLKQIQKLENNFKISSRIPQLNELNDYLKAETGFTIRPTFGIISQRQFFNTLAFKVFCATQYIRHPMYPDYTPEPDVVHQIIGHVPTFADPEIAELSHKIGLLSLGASDDQIQKLGNLYMATLQFGVCKEGNKKLAYGAGIASSIGEIQHILSNKSNFEKFNLLNVFSSSFPIQAVQQAYHVVDSFNDGLEQIKKFGNQMPKNVTTSYNFTSNQINYNRNIEGVFSEDKGPKF